MKIYFASSISGGQQYLPGMTSIVKEIRDLGHEVLTGFVIGEGYCQGYPTDNAWERDIPLLQESDAVIAEISQMSTGVGIELGIASVAFGKPILCLRDKSLELSKLSQLVAKGPFSIAHYDSRDKSDIVEILQNFLRGVENLKEGKITRERENR